MLSAHFYQTTQMCYPSMIDIHSRLLTLTTRLLGRNVPGDAFPISYGNIYTFIRTCACEYMRDDDGRVAKYRPISTNTGREARRGRTRWRRRQMLPIDFDFSVRKSADVTVSIVRVGACQGCRRCTARDTRSLSSSL